MERFFHYVRKVSWKTNITPWYTQYQGVRNVSFSENFVNVLNELYPYCLQDVDSVRIRFAIYINVFQRYIQNPVFAKTSILDVWQGSEYASVFSTVYCRIQKSIKTKRVMGTKLTYLCQFFLPVSSRSVQIVQVYCA